jgi:hypothetical protein
LVADPDEEPSDRECPWELACGIGAP